MGHFRRRWRVWALVGLFLLTMAASTLVRMQVPSWIGPSVQYPFILLFLGGSVYLARRWWPDPPPEERPPVLVDTGAPLPGAETARRAVFVGGISGVLSLLITVALVVAAVTWVGGGARDGWGGAPEWYQATVLIGGSAGLCVVTVAGVLQFFSLRRAVARVTAGSEPRWAASVVRLGSSTLSVNAARVDRAGDQLRDVRLTFPLVPELHQLQPGDEVLIDGSLRRGAFVAIRATGRTRWVSATWRQRRSIQRSTT